MKTFVQACMSLTLRCSYEWSGHKATAGIFSQPLLCFTLKKSETKNNNTDNVLGQKLSVTMFLGFSSLCLVPLMKKAGSALEMKFVVKL